MQDMGRKFGRFKSSLHCLLYRAKSLASSYVRKGRSTKARGFDPKEGPSQCMRALQNHR